MDDKKAVDTEIQAALDAVNEWLKPDEITVECRKDRFLDGKLGHYEYDSVFTKTIEVVIDPDNIRKACDEDDILYADFLTQIRLTIFHETGHALVNQIMDWAENIDTVKELSDGPFGKYYFDVFDDENITEEDLVEEFAYGFFSRRSSPLENCWEELRGIVSETSRDPYLYLVDKLTGNVHRFLPKAGTQPEEQAREIAKGWLSGTEGILFDGYGKETAIFTMK